MTTAKDFSFTKASRLLNSKSYKPVFDRGRKIGGRFLLLLYVENAINSPRLGVIVAKKRVRRAVGRNRIKRLVRESFRLHQHAIKSCDIVILARDGIADQPNAVILAELEKKWQKLSKSV